MRQAMFVIAVVGAAFAGGAVVNGPGFRWAQERLLLYVGLQDEGEIASIDLPAAPGEEPKAAAAAPAAPLVKEPEVQAPPAPKAEPKATEPFVAVAVAAPAAPAGDPKRTAPPPGAAEGPTQSPEPAPLDPSVAPAANAEPAATDAPPKDAPPSGDWAELRGKLAAAGVTRYTIEGEPGGRVVFACLIPLAGKQAVAQRFEAEGDDEFQAARAALRRVNLWRAAQAQPPK